MAIRTVGFLPGAASCSSPLQPSHNVVGLHNYNGNIGAVAGPYLCACAHARWDRQRPHSHPPLQATLPKSSIAPRLCLSFSPARVAGSSTWTTARQSLRWRLAPPRGSFLAAFAARMPRFALVPGWGSRRTAKKQVRSRRPSIPRWATFCSSLFSGLMSFPSKTAKVRLAGALAPKEPSRERGLLARRIDPSQRHVGICNRATMHICHRAAHPPASAGATTSRSRVRRERHEGMTLH
jgi:hypothetical protein